MGGMANLVDLGFSDDGGNSFDPALGPTATTMPQVRCRRAQRPTRRASRPRRSSNVFFDVSNNNFSIVPTPPVASIAAIGGAVDQACTFKVQFTAAVEDDCGVNKNDVVVKASSRATTSRWGRLSSTHSRRAELSWT